MDQGGLLPDPSQAGRLAEKILVQVEGGAHMHKYVCHMQIMQVP